QHLPSSGRDRQQGAWALTEHAAKGVRATLARPSASWGYPAAYLVVLLSFIAIWFRHSLFLYIGRDADLSLWLGRAYLDWARPFDVTAMNPLQGMTSMLVAINPYFNPAVWIFQTSLPEISKQVISFIIYFIEVTLSSFALGLALGFSRPFALAASLWLAVLLFPPLNFVFGLYGWLATNPFYGHTLTLSNLLLIASSILARRAMPKPASAISSLAIGSSPPASS